MSICNAYHTRRGRGICWGTKDCDPCFCGGNESKCDFYPEVRQRAQPIKTHADRIRAMSDEELAKTIARKITGCYGCRATNELECAECVLEWLKKEADNG